MPNAQKEKASQAEEDTAVGVKRPAEASSKDQFSVTKKLSSSSETNEETRKSWVYVVIHTQVEDRRSEGSDDIVSIHRSAKKANKAARKYFRENIMNGDEDEDEVNESENGGLYRAEIENNYPGYQECWNESVEVRRVELED